MSEVPVVRLAEHAPCVEGVHLRGAGLVIELGVFVSASG